MRRLVCPACSTANSDDSSFCKRCGARFAPTADDLERGADSILAAARDTQRSAAWKGIWAGAGVAALVNPLTNTLLAEAPLFGAAAVGAVVYWRAIRTKKMAVLVRRFHRGAPGGLLVRALGGACKGLATLVTVRDSAFGTSWEWGFSRLAVWIPIAFFLGTIVLGLGAVLALPLAELLRIPLDDSGPLMVVTMVVAMGLYSWVLWFVVRRYGIAPLHTSEHRERTERLLDDVKRGRGHLTGVTVVRCHDHAWQDVVGECIARADAVVVDLTDRSANVVWELRQAFARLPPRAILLVVAVNDPLKPAFPGEVSSWLREQLGARADLAPRLTYVEASSARDRRYRAAIEQLRDGLARCLAAAASAHLPR